MYFVEKIKEITNKKETIIFVDMDGVIADYEFGSPIDYKNKRPIRSNIAVFEELSKLSHVRLEIMSIGRTRKNIYEKNDWLDLNAPFFDKVYRNIFAKREEKLKGKEIKCKFLEKRIKENPDIFYIVVDDDNEILKYLKSNHGENIVLFQDSSLVD